MSFYGTASGFNDYHEARGRVVAGFTNDEIEAALLLASEWLDGRYAGPFGTFKTGGREQVRTWPQIGYLDRFGYSVVSTAVPTEAENAAYLAAFEELSTAGALTKNYTPNKYKRVAVDGAVSVEFNPFNSAFDAQTQFPLIDQILEPLIGGAMGNVSPLSGKICRA